MVLTTIPDNIVFWSDPDRQEGCDSASIPLSCQTLEEMELQGADISQYEPVINRFFRLKAPSSAWTPLPGPDFGETIFSESPFLNPVEPLHQPSLPVLSNPLIKPRLNTYVPPLSCPTEPEDNMVDLDELIHPGTDPPGNDTPFPDRLRSSIAFWD